MREIKENTYKGTRILLGNEKRDLINRMIDVLKDREYVEIQIPIIQNLETFRNKVGDENRNMMFLFSDRGNRELCLAPEYTAVIQSLSDTFKYSKDVKLFYVQECFRGERPQAGRYRQFTQLGVEIINPSKDYVEELSSLALELVSNDNVDRFKVDMSVTRGLDYYKDGKGFEISCDELGAQKQVCGGGEYDGGIGFAIGIDRILLIN